jgi:GntR family transcriptional regulator
VWITAIDATILVVMTPVRPPEYSETTLSLGAVDRSGEFDLHEQVAAEIRRAIAEGEAKPGERIPQATDLAAVLGVHTNTVLRALRMLRDEGLLEVGRGRAITVAGTPEQGAVIAKIKELVEFGRRNGHRRDELVSMPQAFPR